LSSVLSSWNWRTNCWLHWSNRGKQTYISPSDTIMSPCTAKLSAYRSKQVGK
jgi:hypothetical protein